jgi:hypothetical protein
VSRAIEQTAAADRRNEWIWLGVLTAVLVGSVIWHPLDEGGFVICLLRRATGLPCPGCGLTRSFCAIAKGQVDRSFHFHALGPVLFAMACVYWLRGIAAVSGLAGPVDRFDGFVARYRIGVIVVVAMLVAWIVKLATHSY